MGVEISRIIEGSINEEGITKAAEVLLGTAEAKRLSIEINGQDDEVLEKQDVSTSVRIPKVIGLASLTQDIREGLKREADLSTSPELVYSLLGEKSKTLQRFSDILSRIEVLKKILSVESTNKEIINQIESWKETINQILDQTLGDEDRDKFKASILEKIEHLSSRQNEVSKDSYHDRFKKLVQNPRALKHLKRYLRPERGEKFGTELIKEYFETANFINILNLMKKLEAPIDQVNQRGERIVVPEINFLDAKKIIQDAILEIEKLKTSVHEAETKKAKISEQDQKIKDILIMCGNKIDVLFPHDESIPHIQTSTLKNVLSNEKAICAGKVESFAAICEFFGLEYNKILIPQHTYIDIKLPSGKIVIVDGNFGSKIPDEINRFYMLEAEPLDQKLLEQGIQNLEEDIQKRIIRRKGLDGKLKYFLADRNPDYQSHLTGDITSNEYPIPTMVFSNASEEFKSDELRRFVNNFNSEFQINRANFYELKNETCENILKLLESGKISPENILSVSNLNLADILNYIKSNNPQVLEKIIKENLNFINTIKIRDKIYFENSDFLSKELIMSTYSKESDIETQVTEFLESAKFNNYKIEFLIKGLLKTEIDITQVYRLLNFAKENDEKYWEEFNTFVRIYFEMENYLKLSPNIDVCIRDFNELIEKRKLGEKENLEYSNSQIIKTIILNLFKNNQLLEFLTNEEINEKSKDMVIKTILEKIDIISIELNLQVDERNRAIISILEDLKVATNNEEQIININSILLLKYDKDDPKLTPLILEIKEKDAESFYSSIFSIEKVWHEFPEKRLQLFEDILQNKNLLFSTRKDFSDELNKKIYYNSFFRLLKIIENDLGTEAKDRLIKETGFEQEPTN